MSHRMPKTKYIKQIEISETNCSCKFNYVAKFHCQKSVTKVSELSNISNLCCVRTKGKLIVKVSVTNNLRQRKHVR